MAAVPAPTLILLGRNEGGNRSPEGGFSPDLGTWPIQSTRCMPLFSRQAARPFVGVGSQPDRSPVSTTGAKPAADAQARAVHSFGGSAPDSQTRLAGVAAVAARLGAPALRA